MIAIQVSGVADFGALGERWRDLEQRADPTFFQTWTWTGCLAVERFPDPVLVAATEAGRTVALALFNRVRQSIGPSLLHLGESGDPARDCPYIEQNGVLSERGREEELTEACVRAVAATHVLVLSGIGELTMRVLRRAAALVCIVKSSEAPFADLSVARAAGAGPGAAGPAGARLGPADFLAGRSTNTRQQVRRSDRSYAARGAVTLSRADSLAAAQAMLDAMAGLHQSTWSARGLPGSFANPFFGRFHHALIKTALPRGEIALTAVQAGDSLIGILYNLSYRGRILAYQSGFDYAATGPHEKPGLTCHHAAIRHAQQDGAAVYDFLAGAARYKGSLSDGRERQYWVEAGPVWSPRLLSRRLRAAAGGFSSRRKADAGTE